MVAFTGSHVGIYNVAPALVFEAATRPQLIDRWIIGQFENVRVEGTTLFKEGSRFLADEVLALNAREMDHLYEVIDYEPARSFAVRCIDGSHYTGELKLQAQVGGKTQISWTFGAAPSRFLDRVLCIVLYAKTRRHTQQQAEREVDKLIAIAKGLGKPEANDGPGTTDD